MKSVHIGLLVEDDRQPARVVEGPKERAMARNSVDRSERGRCDGCGKWKTSGDLGQMLDVDGTNRCMCLECARKEVRKMSAQSITDKGGTDAR